MDLCVLEKCSASHRHSPVVVAPRRHWMASLLVIRGRVLVVCSAARRVGPLDAVTTALHSPAPVDICWQVRCGFTPS